MAMLGVRKLNQIICLFIGILSHFDGGSAINDEDTAWYGQQSPSYYNHPPATRAGNSENFVILQTSEDRRQVTIKSGITWVRETASWEMKDDRFLADHVLREITDGLSHAAIVFDGRGRMRDCHISHDNADIAEKFILDAVKDTTLCFQSAADEKLNLNRFEEGDTNKEDGSNLPTNLFFPTSSNDTSSFGLQHCKRFSNLLGLPSQLLNMTRLVNHCQQFRASVPYSDRTSTHHLDHSNLSFSNVLHHRNHHRSRRSILYPGTLWCGAGHSAKSEYELGEKTFTDRCCRAHDLCPQDMQINSFKTKYHFTNKNMFTLSHCACDKRFHKCLRQVRNTVSYEVGNWYFNILSSQCFVVRRKKQCVEKGWWGKCNREEKRPTAMLRQAQVFPKTLKKHRSGKRRRS